MDNIDFLIIHGAPGTGKTTVAKVISEKLKSPWVEFGNIPEFRNLTPEKTISFDDEQQIAYEALIASCHIYINHGYKNFVLTDFDFDDKKLLNIIEEFKDKNYLIINLYLDDNETIKNRVLSRDNGNNYRDYEHAINLNRIIKKSPLLPNEHRIESSISVNEIVEKIFEIMKNYQKQEIAVEPGAGDYTLEN